jgi:hypothetical protein
MVPGWVCRCTGYLAAQVMAASAHADAACTMASWDAVSPAAGAGSATRTACSRPMASCVAATPSSLYACGQYLHQTACISMACDVQYATH